MQEKTAKRIFAAGMVSGVIGVILVFATLVHIAPRHAATTPAKAPSLLCGVWEFDAAATRSYGGNQEIETATLDSLVDDAARLDLMFRYDANGSCTPCAAYWVPADKGWQWEVVACDRDGVIVREWGWRKDDYFDSTTTYRIISDASVAQRNKFPLPHWLIFGRVDLAASQD